MSNYKEVSIATIWNRINELVPHNGRDPAYGQLGRGSSMKLSHSYQLAKILAPRFGEVVHGPVRTLADMSEAEVVALEIQYGCKVKRP